MEEYEKAIEFEIGDKVVHPYHGAGIVIGIEERDFTEEFRRYYVIDLIAYNGILMVPITNAQKIGLRQVCETSAIPRVMEILCAPPNELPEDHKERRAWLEEKMKDRDIESVTEVVRDLAWRERRDGLTTVDARLYEEAQTFLASELALVEGMELEEAKEKLHAILEKGWSNSA